MSDTAKDRLAFAHLIRLMGDTFRVNIEKIRRLEYLRRLFAHEHVLICLDLRAQRSTARTRAQTLACLRLDHL